MASFFRNVVALAGWIAFPVVPLLVQDAYYSLCTAEMFRGKQLGPDPYDWEQATWALILGPLLGYGFLAGSTWKIADEPGRSRWRSWLHRRSVWVGLGPWVGYLTVMATIMLFSWAVSMLRPILPAASPAPASNATAPVDPWRWVNIGFWLTLAAWVSLGWMTVAVATLRRARRAGQIRAAFLRGSILAIGFAGTLFGGYWLITSWWRGYFFDPTIVP